MNTHVAEKNYFGRLKNSLLSVFGLDPTVYVNREIVYFIGIGTLIIVNYVPLYLS